MKFDFNHSYTICMMEYLTLKLSRPTTPAVALDIDVATSFQQDMASYLCYRHLDQDISKIRDNTRNANI